MRNKLLILFISIFIFTGCATNPYVNGKNVGGVIGASGGAYGGSVLTRKSSNGVKIAGIAGGALLGWLVGSKVGEYFDEKDKQRQVRLIEDTLENNRDNQTSTDTYKKTWRNPNTGQTEQHTVQQSVTPLRTYQQPQRNVYLENDIRPLPRRNNQIASSGQFCREYTIDVKIDKNLTGGLEDTKTQYFNSCRSQSGWRTIQ